MYLSGSQIVSLLRGSIAERSGVRVGHRIIEINGTSTVRMEHANIVQHLCSIVGDVCVCVCACVCMCVCVCAPSYSQVVLPSSDSPADNAPAHVQTDNRTGPAGIPLE